MTVSGWAAPSAVLGVVYTFTPLALICVILRLHARRTHIGVDDICVTFSIFFTSVFAICVGVQVHFGLCQHAKDLSKHQLLGLGKAFWISIWNYYLGLGLAKLSIVIQCIRIFGHIRSFRIAAYALGAVITVFTLWTFFVSVFLCQPISYFWNHDQSGKCLPRLPLWFFNSSFNILTDILTAILPLPVVNSLQMPRRQRRMLMAVLGLGGAICVVSLIRFYALYAVAITKDPAWDNPQAALYANLEATTGIIASCLPTLKGLGARYFPKMFSTSYGGRSGERGTGERVAGGSASLPMGGQESNIELSTAFSKKSQTSLSPATPTLPKAHPNINITEKPSTPQQQHGFDRGPGRFSSLLGRRGNPKHKVPRMVIDSQMQSTCEASPTEAYHQHPMPGAGRSIEVRRGSEPADLEKGLKNEIQVVTTVEQREDYGVSGRGSGDDLVPERMPFERP